MKNIYNPDYEDIIEWSKGDLSWPDQDWEAYVMDSECDELIINFANTKGISNEREEYLRNFFCTLYIFL